MKKDMDYIFKKIRAIKTKLNAQYPTQFAEAVRSSLAEEAAEDGEASVVSGEGGKEEASAVITDVEQLPAASCAEEWVAIY